VPVIWHCRQAHASTRGHFDFPVDDGPSGQCCPFMPRRAWHHDPACGTPQKGNVSREGKICISAAEHTSCHQATHHSTAGRMAAGRGHHHDLLSPYGTQAPESMLTSRGDNLGYGISDLDPGPVASILLQWLQGRGHPILPRLPIEDRNACETSSISCVDNTSHHITKIEKGSRVLATALPLLFPCLYFEAVAFPSPQPAIDSQQLTRKLLQMPWKDRFPMKRSGNAGDISPIDSSDDHGRSSTGFAGKSLESGLNHGRAKPSPDEKATEHLEKVEHQDDAVVEKLNKRQRLKRHCGRRWKWYLLGTIIFLAIMLPVL
jgi:hypothetical protein